MPQHVNVRNLRMFQCSSASRKFLNGRLCCDRICTRVVSVLFSEPKIPQWGYPIAARGYASRFSALQRAENSSMITEYHQQPLNVAFQCSSASRKFLNPVRRYRDPAGGGVSVLFSEPKIPQLWVSSPLPRDSFSFSALQRAENSSIVDQCDAGNGRHSFQCSSASRKFLNSASRSANT